MNYDVIADCDEHMMKNCTHPSHTLERLRARLEEAEKVNAQLYDQGRDLRARLSAVRFFSQFASNLGCAPRLFRSITDRRCRDWRVTL